MYRGHLNAWYNPLFCADLQINKNLAEKKNKNTTTNEADRCAHNKPKLSQAVSLKKHFSSKAKGTSPAGDPFISH